MDTNKIICFTLALALFSSYAAPHSYVERDGVVAIEAEDYTERDGAWQIVEGRNATAQGSGITRDFKMHLNGAASGSAPVELPSLQPFLWGIPGPMAKTYATLDVDRGRVTAFLYPRGAQMPGGAAPATRAALFLLPTNAPGALAQVFSQVVSDSLGGAQGQRAALIGIRTNLVGTDARLKSALESSGLAVTAFDEKQATADALREFQLVAISETAHAEKLHGGVLGLAVPIISFDPQTLQRLGMVKQRSAQLHENAVLISYGAWTNHVRYAIYFSQPGAYKLWLYGRDGGEGGANEVKVFFNTNE
ncbi:MAG TPA: hypothetical protein VEH27_06080, partial [Methylomirabilota bacterium]|nr:hypothetical protein [Methylomirabilota bacterium]